jgi:hypothetical protein
MFAFVEHPHDDGPRRPILLEVDEQLAEGSCLWVPPVLADHPRSLEVRQQQDVEQLRPCANGKALSRSRSIRSTSRSVGIVRTLSDRGDAQQEMPFTVGVRAVFVAPP